MTNSIAGIRIPNSAITRAATELVRDSESRVNNGQTRIYRPGEGWSEPPGAIHSISRNAS